MGNVSVLRRASTTATRPRRSLRANLDAHASRHAVQRCKDAMRQACSYLGPQHAVLVAVLGRWLRAVPWVMKNHVRELKRWDSLEVRGAWACVGTGCCCYGCRCSWGATAALARPHRAAHSGARGAAASHARTQPAAGDSPGADRPAERHAEAGGRHRMVARLATC